MSRHTFFLCLILAWSNLAPNWVRAQQTDVADTLYGRGVEDYFAGRLQAANSDLSRAIAFNSNDPRPYYFRALSRIAQGCQDAARDDLQIGSMLEAQQPNRFAMGKTLERVQGPQRLLLERYRQSARLNAPAVARPNVSPAAATESDTGVLRERMLVPLDQLLQPGVPRSIPAPPAAPSNSTPPSASPPAQAPANPAPAPEDNPFGDDSAAKSPPQMPPAATTAPPNTTAPTTAPPSQAASPEKRVAPTPPQAPKPLPPAPKSSSNDEDPFK